jgi:hypothetical protein
MPLRAGGKAARPVSNSIGGVPAVRGCPEVLSAAVIVGVGVHPLAAAVAGAVAVPLAEVVAEVVALPWVAVAAEAVVEALVEVAVVAEAAAGANRSHAT